VRRQASQAIKRGIMQDLMLKLQTDIRSIVTSFETLQRECTNIHASYFKSDASTTLGAKADGDPVTVTTKLTKLEFINGITFCEELDDFFTNQAVEQADYLATCENIKYGNDEATSVLSIAVEALGDRLYQVAIDSITLFNSCLDILDLYNDTEIATAASGLSNQTVMFGASMTKSQLSLAMTMIEQFKKMINNEVVTQGDYASTIQKWQNIGS
jgi:hypothetical protein